MTREKTSVSRILKVVLPVLVLVVVVTVLLPSHRHSPGYANELSAVAKLRTYLGAQAAFHRRPRYEQKGMLLYANPWNGAGFPDLYEVGGPGSGGRQLKLIDRAFAEAKMGGTPHAGYYLCDIIGRAGTGPYDRSIDCGLCAYPAGYDVTGHNTFITDVSGTLYQKDTHGVPVNIYPAEPAADGWVLVDGE